MDIWTSSLSGPALGAVDNPIGPRDILQLLLLGIVLLSVSIDGSPVAIIYMGVWIALYTFHHSWVRRSITPTLFLIAAGALAAVLDAGYLWPMLDKKGTSRDEPPTHLPGRGRSPGSCSCPHRGKVPPSRWDEHRAECVHRSLPGHSHLALPGVAAADTRRNAYSPLTVSVVSICLGMGSLHSLGLPVWLSPFDWIRPLPGFRSIGATGRYWGFLALPLSLAATEMAICRYTKDAPEGPRKTLLLGAALLTQLISRLSLLAQPSRTHVPTHQPLCKESTQAAPNRSRECCCKQQADDAIGTIRAS